MPEADFKHIRYF